jgi:hypothetical protein
MEHHGTSWDEECGKIMLWKAVKHSKGSGNKMVVKAAVIYYQPISTTTLIKVSQSHTRLDRKALD